MDGELTFVNCIGMNFDFKPNRYIPKGRSGVLEDFYSWGDRLGKGGFASVYRATRRRDNLKVAIKRLYKNRLWDWAKVS